MSSPRPAGSGRQAATTSRGETAAPPTRTGVVESRPSSCNIFRISTKRDPSPYLKVTRRASTQRGMRSTSSCSTLTHSTGPMPSGKSKTSGSLNGSVVNQPRPASQTTGGLRHSSIVVQMLNDGGEVVAADGQVRTVPDAELLDVLPRAGGLGPAAVRPAHRRGAGPRRLRRVRAGQGVQRGRTR